MRTLLVTPHIAWPLRFGGEIRRWNLLQGLLEAGEVDALVFRRGDQEVSDQAFAGCKRVTMVDPTFVLPDPRDACRYQSTFGRGIMTLGRTLPFEYQVADMGALHAHVRELVDVAAYDVVWIATARIAARLDCRGANAIVLDGDDFGYVREWLLLRSSPWYGAKVWNYLDVAKLRRLESRLHTRFSYVVRCSEEDRDRHPADNVVVIPNGARVPSTFERDPQNRLIFVGELAYGPNRQGIEWFLERVWPRIVAEAPGVGLDIVGRNPSAAVRTAHGRHGVVVHGFVDDLAALYKGASMSIVPLLAGGGTRLKILESLALNVPVVSTTIGAFGLRLGEDEGLTRVDKPDEFALACVRALGDREFGEQCAARGRAAVIAHYDWRAIQRRVAALTRLAAGGRATAAPEDLLLLQQ